MVNRDGNRWNIPLETESNSMRLWAELSLMLYRYRAAVFLSKSVALGRLRPY